ncbi:hypothetical protein Tco_0740614 [Tanacetum coccineum]
MSLTTVTYTLITSDYEEPSDVGSPRVVVYGYDGLPMHLVDPYVEVALQAPEQAPLSPDYVSGHEHPPSPDYVPEPEYLEYLVPSNAEAPMKDQPLLTDASPAALSPGYVADFDPKKDLEEDPINYATDADDDEEEEESSDDDDDEEEEHLAPADSTIIASPAIDLVPFAEETGSFETDESAATTPPPPAYCTTSGMSVRTQTPIPFPSEAEVARLLALPTTPLYLLHYDLPKADMLLWKRACFAAPTSRFEVGESLSTVAAREARHTLAHIVAYGFIDTMDASIYAAKSRAMTAEARDDLALLRAQVFILRRERRYFSLMASSYERKAVIARQAWSHSKSRIQAMEAQIRAL